jgi:hypothetical protein
MDSEATKVLIVADETVQFLGVISDGDIRRHIFFAPPVTRSVWWNSGNQRCVI